jgi:mevalonate kinase
MTGGGFGGCVVALTRPDAIDPAAWPGRAWAVQPSAGVSRQVHRAG